MAYGIESYGSSGYLQFSTETQENFTVIDTGSDAYGNEVTYNNANEILCMNIPTSSGILKGNHIGTTKWENLSTNTAGSGIAVNWIKLKRTSVSGVSAENSAGSYGLRVFNSSGALTYGSNFSEGQEILDVIPTFGAAGGGEPTPYTKTGNTIIYSGDPAGVYVSPPQQTSAAGSNWKAYYNWIYFDHSNNKLRFVAGYWFHNGFFGVWLPRYNTSAIMIFKQKG